MCLRVLLILTLSLFSAPLTFFPPHYLSCRQPLFFILIIAAFFPHPGTLRWVDPSSRLQRAMTIPWEVGGRFGSASINLCAQPCGKWCLTLMVRATFYLVFIWLCWRLGASIWLQCRYKSCCLLVFANAAVHVLKKKNDKKTHIRKIHYVFTKKNTHREIVHLFLFPSWGNEILIIKKVD